ncbi:MAG: acyl carrier protein [Burkholderiales bacterium]|nr:acyl carrier protein [Burkholderiales bacterium]
MESLLIVDLAKLLNMQDNEITRCLNLKKHNYWDSLAIVSLIGSIDNYYNIGITGEELTNVETVDDIFNLIEHKICKRI